MPIMKTADDNFTFRGTEQRKRGCFRPLLLPLFPFAPLRLRGAAA